MYTIKADGKLIAMTENPLYLCGSAVLQQQTNTADKFMFSIYPSNPAYNDVCRMKSTISVFDDAGAEIFRGRATDEKTDFYGEKSYVCEGVLAWLNDILHPEYTTAKTDTAVNTLADLITSYNANAIKSRKIFYGLSEISGNVTLAASTDRKSILSLLKEVVTQRGGYIDIFYNGGNVYLGMINTPKMNRQPIIFGKNLLDLEQYIDASKVVTYIYPVGKNGLKLGSGASAYLANYDAASRYGRIEEYKSFSDCETTDALRTAAWSYLVDKIAEATTITLSAVDLSVITQGVDKLCINDNVRVVSDPHGLDTMMQVTSVSTDLCNPAKTKITIGSSRAKITRIIAKGV